MIDLKPIIAASAMLLLVNACDSVIDPDTVDFSEIYVAAHSTIDAGLDGTYTTGCYVNSSGVSYNEDLRIRGNTWNYTINDFGLSYCTAAPIAGTISGTFRIDGADIPITGWIDNLGNSIFVPPDTADDSANTLSLTEPVTPLLITISGATGSLATSGTSSFFYVVDDTGADNVLYRDWKFDDGAAVVASNYAPYKEININSTEVFVAAHSGTDAGLNGTYSTICYLVGTSYIDEDLVILGNKWDYTKTEYPSIDCITELAASTISGTFNIDGTAIPIDGWVDNLGNSVLVPPDTADITDEPALTLSATESVTPLLLTISNATGSLFPGPGASSFFFVVDDSGTNNVLYRDVDFDPGVVEVAGNFNPYTKQ